jgi:hypothetical protein
MSCDLLTIRLGDILSDLCQRLGVPYHLDASVDVEIQGYIVTKQMPARAALEGVMQAHLVDAYEADGRIVFVKRGGSVRASYTTDDLAAHEQGGEPPDILPIRRVNESELPRKINVQYMDPEREYEAGVQYASRLAGLARSEAGLDLAIAMDPDAAAQIAERLLVAAWVGRETVGPFFLPYTEIDLRPTDVIQITDEGVTHRVRLTKVQYQAAGVIQCEGALEIDGMYESSATAVHGTGFGASAAPEPQGDVTFHWIDLNLLEDSNDPAGIYVCAGSDGLFNGATLQISYDGAVTWIDAQWMEYDPILGEATTALPEHPAETIDRTNTLRVELLDADNTLSTIAPVSALARTANVAILGDEIIIFETATLVSAGVYDLTGLHRGLRGTDTHTAHAVGDRFILLDLDSVYRLPIADSRLGKVISYRVVPYDEEASGYPTETETYVGYAYWPYAVAHLAAMDAGGGNYDVTWVRRDRLDGEWRDLVDVPLSEAAESYRVEVRNGATLTHSTTVSSPSATVPASAGNTVTVRQISAKTGAGHPRSITL